MSFDKFPLEIIQHVFALCCGAVKFIIPQPRGSHIRTTQVTLSLVCSRWREIALNTGVIWGDVVVVYNARSSRQEPATLLQAIKNWLNRAGTLPISLSILISAAEELQINALSQTLLSSSHIKQLDLRSIDCLLLIPMNNLDFLETLRLSSDGAPREVFFPRLPNMPSLRELSLGFHPSEFVDLTNLWTVHWHQLQVLVLESHYWPAWISLEILKRCESLVVCTLSVMTHEEQPEHDIVLTNLESLVLNIKGGGGIADHIFRSLALPNLKTLSIRSWKPCLRIPLDSASIQFMAKRSGFKYLTDFSLYLTRNPVDVRSLLESMPVLESVEIHGPLTFHPGTFDDLSAGIIGPQLEKIYFGAMADQEIELMLETIGKRYEKAKTVSGIKAFSSITGHCIGSGSAFGPYGQRAEQCGRAFNAHVVIPEDPLTIEIQNSFSPLIMSDFGESDSDILTDSTSGPELPGVVVSDESVSDEEFHLYEESVSDEEFHSYEESNSDNELYSDEESHSNKESYSNGELHSDQELYSDRGSRSDHELHSDEESYPDEEPHTDEGSQWSGAESDPDIDVQSDSDW